MLAAVRESGSASEPWVTQGASLLDSIATGGTTISERACAIAGCGAVFEFSSMPEYLRQRASAESSTAFEAWTGGKQWSTPETLEDGRVVVALVLYRPD